MRIVAIIPTSFNADVRASAVVRDADALRRELPGTDVLVLSPRYGDVLREVWPEATSVRWIHSLGAGVEKLPFDLLRQSDVVVTNAKGVYADGLAEFVIGAMLYFAKDLRGLITNQAAKKWDPKPVDRLEGATCGIIGYGSIGAAIGNRAQALGMHLLTVRRQGGTPLADLLAQSDYVVLSTPLTNATHHLMNADRLALMRATAVLINVSRGEVVDEAALVKELGRIRGAALDVFETEPLPASSPLWTMENVLISPHSADLTRDSHQRAVELFQTNVERYRKGEPLLNVVDKTAGY